MSKEKRSVPKLRFPGFTEDWEQRKLGDITKTNPFKSYLSNAFEIGEYEVIQQGEVPIVGYADGSPCYDYENITIFGDHTLSLFKPNKPFFVASDGVKLLSPIVKIEGLFYYYLLEKYKPKSEGYKRHFTILKNCEAYFSNNIEEQTKISSLLNKMDSIITLHQRKLEHLNLKKKALLQKLFPKNGERYPELRFPGFTDAWEQRKLGDFYTFKNGLNKEKVYFGYGDSIVNFTDVFHNRQIYSSTLKGKVFVNKKELENFKVKEGDLFFTRTSETIDEIGFPAVVMEPMERVVFSGFVLRGRAEKNDPLVNIFKSYIFFTDNFRSEMKKKSSMTTRALTSGTALKEMYFSYPKDLEEQTKIGEILLRLDNVITLHQRKLEHLQLQKKALLQQMFV